MFGLEKLIPRKGDDQQEFLRWAVNDSDWAIERKRELAEQVATARQAALDEISRLHAERDRIMPTLIAKKMKALEMKKKHDAESKVFHHDLLRANAECFGRDHHFQKLIHEQQVLLLNLPMPAAIDSIIHEFETAKRQCERLVTASPSVASLPLEWSEKRYNEAIAEERDSYRESVQARVRAINAALARARRLQFEPVDDLQTVLADLRESIPEVT